jgi:hypothetical protein
MNLDTQTITILGMLLTGIVGIASTLLGILWVRTSKDYEELKVGKRECDAKHEIAIAKIGELEARAGAIQYCPVEACPLQPDKPKRQTTRIQPRPRAA